MRSRESTCALTDLSPCPVCTGVGVASCADDGGAAGANARFSLATREKLVRDCGNVTRANDRPPTLDASDRKDQSSLHDEGAS